MRIELHVVGWKDFRPLKAKSGNVSGSLAWSNHDDGGTAHVYVRRGAQWLLWGLARIAHELEHCLDTEFRNKDHHPAGHFCIRSYNFVRKWDHAEKTTPGMARLFRSQGWLEA